jgi:site-specific DNA-cytosine methylase
MSPLKVLEIFAGTKSFTKECEKVGWECTTVDIDPKFEPSILIDIMQWDYKSHPVPDVLWCGCPCTTFSIASFKRKPEVGNVLVKRTLEIIEHYKKLNANLIWAIENPWSSLLRKQDFMQGIPYKVCDYCCYGFPYRKRTVIFGNIEWIPKLCPGKGKCEQMVGPYHLCTAQQGRQLLSRAPLQQETWTREELYRMPPELCRELVQAIMAQIPEE